jgi:type 1 glutamine amidotransferase
LSALSTLSRRDFVALGVAAVAAGTRSDARAVALESRAKPTRIVLLAGTPSHPPGMHEHNAGVLLFEKCLQSVPNLELRVVRNGYPKDDSILDDADGLFVYADGGRGHPLAQPARLEKVRTRCSQGMGLFCCHFAVEVVPGPTGDAFRDWIGGCYEHEWSCNPMWTAEFSSLPKHPITEGVSPFQIHDEWYFNMRFRPELAGVTPILTATPTDATRDGPYVYPKGPYKHIQAAKGRPEHVMWCTERADGGRGVGFTGGHFHKNWKQDDFRRLVLNAILWMAKHAIPAGGVRSQVSEADLALNLDNKGPKKK